MITLTACAHNAGRVAAPNATIRVLGASETVECNQVQFTARLTSDDRELVAPGVTWSSSDRGVAVVSSSGLVTGVSPGSAVITAASGADRGSLRFSVTAREPYTVTVLPYQSNVEAGATTQLRVIVDVNDADVVTPNVRWVSGAPDVAAVSSTGLVTGLRAGSAAITGFFVDSAEIDTTVCQARQYTGNAIAYVVARAP
ncbi:MAG: Ig-like domain-containing protein [Gemmatimonadales bacterium]